jgi:hypothetical protein
MSGKAILGLGAELAGWHVVLAECGRFRLIAAAVQPDGLTADAFAIDYFVQAADPRGEFPSPLHFGLTRTGLRELLNRWAGFGTPQGTETAEHFEAAAAFQSVVEELPFLAATLPQAREAIFQARVRLGVPFEYRELPRDARFQLVQVEPPEPEDGER